MLLVPAPRLAVREHLRGLQIVIPARPNPSRSDLKSHFILAGRRLGTGAPRLSFGGLSETTYKALTRDISEVLSGLLRSLLVHPPYQTRTRLN